MSEQTACGECGMLVKAGEYHPYLACLAFKQCRDGKQVHANLEGVRAHARREEREACAKVALEQRCERGTPWDLACTTIAAAIRQREGA